MPTPLHRIERLALPPASPGTVRELVVHRFGAPGARPKAYLQASLHADEPPGMLVLHHLVTALAAAAAGGAVKGEIVIVPYANPIGLSQWVAGQHTGRYELGGGGNFNRGYADLTEAVALCVEDRLSGDAAANVAAIRAALLEALAARQPTSELDALRLALLRLSLDADIVLDLHCDEEALLHLYVAAASWPAAADLSAELGSHATLLADSSGGAPFDEAHSLPWLNLQKQLGARHPIPLACLATTVELRGRADVSDALAGDPGPLPPALCAATPLAGADLVAAPAGGILCFTRNLGDKVRAGETVAEIVDPAATDPAKARLPVAGRADGLIFTRTRDRLVRPGMVIAKIAGAVPLPHRTGSLLQD